MIQKKLKSLQRKQHYLSHNLIYRHEIDRLIFLNYKYFSLTARILLAIISVNIIITFYLCLIKNRILTVVISLFLSFEILSICDRFRSLPRIL